jgi:hypothetical protein
MKVNREIKPCHSPVKNPATCPLLFAEPVNSFRPGVHPEIITSTKINTVRIHKTFIFIPPLVTDKYEINISSYLDRIVF